MVDVVDPETRSRMMSGIRGKDTKPERDLRDALENLGMRLETHDPGLPGRPDIVLDQDRVAILVHGCFWHRHSGCRYTTTPASRTEFWQQKFASNVARDARNLDALHQLGWRTVVVWECAVRRAGTPRMAASRIAEWLTQSSEPRLEIGDSSVMSFR